MALHPVAVRRKRSGWRTIALACLIVLAAAGVLFRRYVKAALDIAQISSRYAEFRLESVPTGATVAVFIAHPDDECFIFSGTIARLVQERGAQVTLVALRNDRAAEFAAAAGRLGAAVRAIECRSSESTHRPELDGLVADVLNELNPQVVLSFGPEGMTGHPDHQAVAQSVWRSVNRRGGGVLFLRAVLPREFAGFVTLHAACHEPGWGIGAIQHVPLGPHGKVRSELAGCYASEREVLARYEWFANRLNTEFFAVSRHAAPAHGPRLFDSRAEPLMTADEALLVVHPTACWDLRAQAQPAIHALLNRFGSGSGHATLLVNPEYPFVYTAGAAGVKAFSSPGGEHELRFDVDMLYLAGGSFGTCLDRGLRYALNGIALGRRRRIEIVLPASAIYVITFDDDRTGAITLRERISEAGDGGLAMLETFVGRVMQDQPVGNYPAERQPLALHQKFAAWQIVVQAARGAERVIQKGSAGELAIRLE